jgi:hypothetical protein
MFKVLKDVDCNLGQNKCDLSECSDKSCFECGANHQARVCAKWIIESQVLNSFSPITSEEYESLKKLAGE